MTRTHPANIFALLLALSVCSTMSAAQEQLVRVELSYAAPVDGRPKPNFSPKGMQVALKELPVGAPLPEGAVRPAKSGVIKVGPDGASWIPVLATASATHREDLCLIYLDRNRNGNFTDDGAPLAGVPTQNAKTKAWWTSVNKVELSVPYAAQKSAEPYLVKFWIVRDDSTAAPDVLRFSVGSWRYGTATINGARALVAAMDSDNDALFTKEDSWSVLGADEPKADTAVLTIAEARPMNRLMFVPTATKELALEFRSFSPDGRAINFAVIDRPVSKLADRAPDDALREERGRPRTKTEFKWAHGSKGLAAAIAQAKVTGKKIILDFEATWCGPCHTMDQWIWNDEQVAGALNAGFIGVKIDVDLEKPLVKRFQTKGYPTMIVLDKAAKEIQRVVEYQSSKQMLAFLSAKP